MLDTNAVSEMMADPRGPVGKRMKAVGAYKTCCSVVVACELRFGAKNAPSNLWVARVEEALARLNVLPLQPPVDEYYGQVRAELTRAGNIIGGNDLLIAAHALAENLTLVTGNEKEFRRVNGLRVENWETHGS